ncbi:MAG: hypothetical protein V8R75_03465 [Oscillospiraceae bacterium]
MAGGKVVDLAFCSYEEPMEYDWIPLAEDPMVAVLPAQHPPAGPQSLLSPAGNCQYEKFIMPAWGRTPTTSAPLAATIFLNRFHHA